MSALDNNRNVDRIEAYLLGELPVGEVEQFEAEMETDGELKNAVEQMRELQVDLTAWEADQFRTQMEEIRQELEENEEETVGNPPPTEKEGPNETKPPRKGIPRWYFAVAAGLLLLIIPIYLFLGPSSNTILDRYFEPYEELYTGRGSADEEIKAALADYKAGEFEASLPHFDTYLETAPQDSQATFYSGVAHLAAGEAEEAIPLFRSIMNDEFLFYIPAKWYLALAYIEADKQDDARAILRNLADTDNSYSEKASNLWIELSIVTK